MNLNRLFTAFVASSVLTFTFAVLSAVVFAQETPLTLVQIVTALTSTSSDMSMVDKNAFITQRVKERGVTFALSETIRKEIVSAGAGPALLTAIQEANSSTSQSSTTSLETKTADAKFNRLWVTQNVAREGRLGIQIFTDFVAYNLKSTPLQLTLRFQGPDGEMYKSDNVNFANKSGQLAVYKNFTPGFDAAEYKDWSTFVPYDILPIDSGNTDLRIAADIIYPDGTVLKHLVLQPVTVTKPKPAATAPNAEFERMWVEYGLTEEQRLGMRIHVKLKTQNLKDVPVWLSIKFEKDSGEKLTAASTLFADRSGGVTLTIPLTPNARTTSYNDVSVFMPYSELNLPKGDYKLRMRTDLIYPDGVLIKHYKYYPFSFKQNR